MKFPKILGKRFEPSSTLETQVRNDFSSAQTFGFIAAVSVQS